jgi:iron(III) transport system ATP-binding protein
LVTHDPQEALAICDRVAVLRAGQIEQWATPLVLVRQPATAFVGRFVLQANLLPGHWRGDRLRTALGEFEPLPGAAARDAAPQAAPQQLPAPAPGCSEESQLFLRPTDLRLAPLDSKPLDTNHLDAEQVEAEQVEAEQVEAEVLSREFLGRSWLYLVGLADLRLRVRQPLEVVLVRGERCRLSLEPGAEPLLFPGGLPLRACP